jgi:hypothetical protein
MILTFDCKVVFGHRDPDLQFELFKRGRVQENGIWVIENIREIVTYKDGYENLSMHNFIPSRAVDVVPYPLDWKDENRMCYFAGMVMERARSLEIKIRWGGDFDMDTELKDQRFVDLPHFEVLE